MTLSRWKKIAVGAVAVLVLIQLVPYGRAHENPPVTGEPTWSDPQTNALFDRACADCHSHQTTWPWYSHVAPVSWLVTHDVEEGREHFDVDAWGREQRNHGDEAAEMVESGEMPMAIYVPLHPEAQLTDAERDTLVKGLIATFGEHEGKDGDDD